jgi:hypothetical protein
MKSTVDAGISIFGFDEPVLHISGVGDLPAEGLLVELDGAWTSSAGISK